MPQRHNTSTSPVIHAAGHLRSVATLIGGTLLMLGMLPLIADDSAQPICRMQLHEEGVELTDAALEMDLSRSNLAAFEQIFKLIEGLRKIDGVDRMSYLRAKYDRDAARLSLEKADLILRRQSALIEQYRLICDGGNANLPADERGRALETSHRRYLQADCDAQAKAIEVADVNLTFNREWLASILDLRRGSVATAQDVIRAELDVEREEKSLADAKRRVEVCRRASVEPAGR